jgi:thymidylate synthase (FAD)
MNVKLLAHTQISLEMVNTLIDNHFEENATHGQLVALTAIRTCYSPGKPSEIVVNEGEKYFGNKGKEGTRLMTHIINSGHTSTLEHINFTFTIEGVSRSLLAQLTRHRHFSYSVQSQRYVKFGSKDKSEGFDVVRPESLNKGLDENELFTEAEVIYSEVIGHIQEAYDELRKLGVPAEDARYVLPNAATCNLVLTGNLRTILDFYSKRGEGTHAQWEIQELAEKMKEAVIKVEHWTEPFFKVGE